MVGMKEVRAGKWATLLTGVVCLTPSVALYK